MTSKWYAGDCGFILRDPRPLKEPIPCRGQLGFFVPDGFYLDHERDMLQQLEEEHRA